LNRHSLFLAGCLFLSWLPLRAQGPGRLPLRNFGVEQGMSSEVVSALVQDRQNLIWAGTEAGLHLFNGQTFEPFPVELPSQMVTDLFPDADGSLWIATQGGLARLQKGKLTSFGPKQGMPEGRVQSVVRDAQGLLWVLASEGLYLENGPGGFSPALPLPSAEIPIRLFAHPKLPGARGAAGRNLWRGGGAGLHPGAGTQRPGGEANRVWGGLGHGAATVEACNRRVYTYTPTYTDSTRWGL